MPAVVRSGLSRTQLACVVLMSCFSSIFAQCVDDQYWNGGWGACGTYAPGGSNEGWCSNDGATVPCAMSCGTCTAPALVGDSTCNDDQYWNGGWGACGTYAPGGSNDGWCSNDGATVPCAMSCGTCTPATGGSDGMPPPPPPPVSAPTGGASCPHNDWDLHMVDSYGDGELRACCIISACVDWFAGYIHSGWSGNSITIYSCDGSQLASGLTLGSGSSGTADVCLVPQPDGYIIECSGGTWGSEVSWSLLGSSGAIMMSGGYGEPYSATANVQGC